MDGNTPVFVLRSGHHGDLGIVRSLGRLGVPVYSAGAEWWEPVCRSRFCAGRFRLHQADGSSAAALDHLLEAGRKIGGGPILIPTSDRDALWVAGHASALREVFRFAVPGADLVRTLCDKSLMQELARSHGVPTAASSVPRSKEDIERFIEAADFPVMIKAIDTESMRRRVGATKVIVHSPGELRDLYNRAEDPAGPNLLIQEFIPGEDWMFDGYFNRHSDCLFGITGKKIRRFPAHTGVTSLGVCIRNHTVEATTAQFMKAIGYHGILDIGYRRDQRDGSYKVLDVNPRIGCTFRLFAGTLGMDVARILYLDLTGQPVPRSSPCVGRKWLVEDFDLLSAFRSWREGALTAAEWAKSLRGVQERACFAIDDPLPLLWIWVSDCTELWRWMRRRTPMESPSSQTPRLCRTGLYDGPI